jgi:hypothetical protein
MVSLVTVSSQDLGKGSVSRRPASGQPGIDPAAGNIRTRTPAAAHVSDKESANKAGKNA